MSNFLRIFKFYSLIHFVQHFLRRLEKSLVSYSITLFPKNKENVRKQPSHIHDSNSKIETKFI